MDHYFGSLLLNIDFNPLSFCTIRYSYQFLQSFFLLHPSTWSTMAHYGMYPSALPAGDPTSFGPQTDLVQIPESFTLREQRYSMTDELDERMIHPAYRKRFGGANIVLSPYLHATETPSHLHAQDEDHHSRIICGKTHDAVRGRSLLSFQLAHV